MYIYKSKYLRRGIFNRERIENNLSDILIFAFSQLNFLKNLKSRKFWHLKAIAKEKDEVESFNVKDFKISIGTVNFTDIFFIEDIDEFVNKFVDLRYGFKEPFSKTFIKGENELKNDLKKLKERYTTTSLGLLDLGFVLKDQKVKNTDLIEKVSFSYNKMANSFFTISASVVPSKTFINEFDKIITSEGKTLKRINFFSFREIIRLKRVIRGTRYIHDSKAVSINNLITDLNFQIKKLIFNNLNGLLSNEKSILLPTFVMFYIDRDQYNANKMAVNKILGLELFKMYENKKENILYNINTGEYADAIFKTSFVLLNTNDFKDEERQNGKAHFIEMDIADRISFLWGIENYITILKRIILKFSYTIFKYINEQNPKIPYRKIFKNKNLLNWYHTILIRIKRDIDDECLKWAFHDSYIKDSVYVNEFSVSKEEISFKDIFGKYIKNLIGNLEEEVGIYLKLFDRTTQDRILKTNLRIQNILIALTFASITLTFFTIDYSKIKNVIDKILAVFKNISF